MLRTCGDNVEDILIFAQCSINVLSTSSPTTTSLPAPVRRSGSIFRGHLLLRLQNFRDFSWDFSFLPSRIRPVPEILLKKGGCFGLVWLEDGAPCNLMMPGGH